MSNPTSSKLLLGTLLSGPICITSVSLYSQTQLSSRSSSRETALSAARTLSTIRKHCACSWRNIKEGRGYTILTGGLLHGSLLHLVINSFVLWDTGRLMCRAPLIGPRAMVAVFGGGIVTGNVTSLMIEARKGSGMGGRVDGVAGRPVERVGMSGGTMAMLATVATVIPRMPYGIFPLPFSVPAFVYVPLFGLFSMYAASNEVMPRIDHMGHIGGMGLGIVAGLILRRRLPL